MSDGMIIDTAICHGKSCIRGLRYSVKNVLKWLDSGTRIDEIMIYRGADLGLCRAIEPM